MSRSDREVILQALPLAARLDLIAPESVEALRRQLPQDADGVDVDRLAEQLLLDVEVLRTLMRLAAQMDPAELEGALLPQSDATARTQDGDSFFAALRHGLRSDVAAEETVGVDTDSPTLEMRPPDGLLGGDTLESSFAETRVPETRIAGARSSWQQELEVARSLPDRRIGRYLLLEEIGAGGMGVVWRGYDESLGRVVAIKLLKFDPGAAGGTLDERFLREARAAASLRHRGIVAVHDVGEVDGRRYLTMDYVAGRTLLGLLRERAYLKARGDSGGLVELRLEIDLLAQVAEAVGHAHREGILHRDIKPENVLIDGDGRGEGGHGKARALLTDFGLAKHFSLHDDLSGDEGEALHTLTRPGAIVGTLSYMSPEQARGERQLTPATDVFSLGVMLYEILTGRLPFAGETIPAILGSIQNEEPALPRKLLPRVPRDLETVCLVCLEKDPQRRYADGAEIALELRRYLDGEPIEARGLGPVRRVRRWVKRHRKLAAGFTLAMLLATTAAIVSLQRQTHFDRVQEVQRDRQRRLDVLRQRLERAHAPWRVGNRELLVQGFDVIAFESGIFDCHKSWQSFREGKNALQSARLGVFGIWTLSAQVHPLIDYIGRENAKGKNPLEVSGFDCRFSAGGSRFLLTDLEAFLKSAKGKLFPGAEWDAIAETIGWLQDSNYKPNAAGAETRVKQPSRICAMPSSIPGRRSSERTSSSGDRSRRVFSPRRAPALESIRTSRHRSRSTSRA